MDFTEASSLKLMLIPANFLAPPSPVQANGTQLGRSFHKCLCGLDDLKKGFGWLSRSR